MLVNWPETTGVKLVHVKWYVSGLLEESCDCVERALNTSPRGWKAGTPLSDRRTLGVTVTSAAIPTLIGRGRNAEGRIGQLVTGKNRCCGKTLFSIVSSSERSESESRETFSRQFRSTSVADVASSVKVITRSPSLSATHTSQLPGKIKCATKLSDWICGGKIERTKPQNVAPLMQ